MSLSLRSRGYKCRPGLCAGLPAAEHARFIFRVTEGQKRGLCSLLPPQKKSPLASSQLTVDNNLHCETAERRDTHTQHTTPHPHI
eukprot:scaffold31115_cov130-Isochrysis_galbana.AAC.1